MRARSRFSAVLTTPTPASCSPFGGGRRLRRLVGRCPRRSMLQSPATPAPRVPPRRLRRLVEALPSSRSTAPSPSTPASWHRGGNERLGVGALTASRRSGIAFNACVVGQRCGDDDAWGAAVVGLGRHRLQRLRRRSATTPPPHRGALTASEHGAIAVYACVVGSAGPPRRFVQVLAASDHLGHRLQRPRRGAPPRRPAACAASWGRRRRRAG
jgi:hypothetical protein